MVHNLRLKKFPDYSVSFSTKVSLLTPVAGADVNGALVSKCEFQAFDIAGSLAPFSSSDFSIQNLESIGALTKLKTTYMSHMHDMNVADKFDSYQIPVNDVK